MSAIGSVLDEAKAVLEGLGWVATRDPDMVIPLTSKHGGCAFIDLPTVEGIGLAGKTNLTIPVHLLTVPTSVGYEALLGLLPDTIRAFGVRDPLTPQTLAMGEVALPGYRLTLNRRIDC